MIGDDRKHLMKVINHSNKLSKWSLDIVCDLVKQIVIDSGLAPLRHTYASTNNLCTTAFVERWHPETNTFHMPFGEMTITLEDFNRITSLKIDGKFLMLPPQIHGPMNKVLAVEMVTHYLGIDRKLVEAEISKNHTKGDIGLEWLMNQFRDKEVDETKKSEVNKRVRAYCLYLLGCTIFCDKSGSGVYVGWLDFLQNVDGIKDLAWGTASLTYLYRQLGIGSRGDTQQICGYSTLLEVWIYEHFPDIFRGVVVQNYADGTPLVSKYKHNLVMGDQMMQLKKLRKVLDDLSPSTIVFDPYQNSRLDGNIPRMSLYRGILLCDKFSEVYLPDRVVRQFGYVQSIPRKPIVPTSSKRLSSGRKYEVTFSTQRSVDYAKWNAEGHSQYINLSKLKKVQYPWDCEEGYMQWFAENSHMHISPSGSMFGGAQPTVGRQRSLNVQELVPNLQEIYALSDEMLQMDDNKTKIPRIVKTKLERIKSLVSKCIGTSTSATDEDDDAEELRSKSRHDRPSVPTKRRKRT